MLIITRREQEQVRIGSDIVVTVVRVSGSKVTLALEAPREVKIVRGELEPKEKK